MTVKIIPKSIHFIVQAQHFVNPPTMLVNSVWKNVKKPSFDLIISILGLYSPSSVSYTFTFENDNLNETFIGGLVASYEYGKNTNMGTFCGVEDEEYIEPETVCVTFYF